MPPSAHSPELVPGAVGRQRPRRPRGLPEGFPPKTATHIARKPWRWPLDLDPRQGSEPHNSPFGSGLVLFHRRNRTRPQCHIADALAELVSYLSIVPHMRSSDVPPKHSAPLTRGFFLPLDFLCREPPVGSGRHHVTASGTISRFPHLLCSRGTSRGSLRMLC